MLCRFWSVVLTLGFVGPLASLADEPAKKDNATPSREQSKKTWGVECEIGGEYT